MLWTEKYSPKNFDQVLGNLKAKNEIMEWVEEWEKGNPQKCLFLLGPPGTGKTTFAHLIAREFSDSIELNASDKRSYDIIIETIGEASASRSLFDDGLKLIILDEVDGIHGREDKGGVRAINKIIKEGHHPLVLIANDPYSKRIKGFKNKCQVLTLRKVHTNSILALLKRICIKEGVEFEEYTLRTLAKNSNGDLRSAITNLEIMARGKESITSEDLKILSKKDEVVKIFDSVRTVLKSKNPAHIKDAMQVDADPAFILELVTENIPREYEKNYEIEKAYEMVSLADIYLGRAFRTRAYTYWKYSYNLMSLGVALAKDETYKKFSRYANSSVYTMLSKSRHKRDLQDRVARKIGDRLHTSKKSAKAQFSYFEIMLQDDEMAYDMAKYFGLSDDEVKLFRRCKIKVKKIKKPKKSAVKNKNDKSKSSNSSSKKINSPKTSSSERAKNKKEILKKSVDQSSSSKAKSEDKTQKSEKKEEQVSLSSFK
jgi:replication factor C large subunit